MSELGSAAAAAVEALRDLYRDVDRIYQHARCDSSTECCRFGVTGREPQVTSVEVALLRAALAKRGGPLSVKRRALPLHARADERTCPLLERSGRCSVYDARPLGCRTYYCERAQLLSTPKRDELRAIVRRLQAIALRHQPQGDRPQALTRALVAARDLGRA